MAETTETTVTEEPKKIVRNIAGKQVEFTPEEDEYLVQLGAQKYAEMSEKPSGEEKPKAESKEEKTDEPVDKLTMAEARKLVAEELGKEKNKNLVATLNRHISKLDIDDKDIKSRVHKLTVVDLMDNPDIDIEASIKGHLAAFKKNAEYVQEKKETREKTKTPTKGAAPKQEEKPRESNSLKSGKTRDRALARVKAARKGERF